MTINKFDEIATTGVTNLKCKLILLTLSNLLIHESSISKSHAESDAFSVKDKDQN